MAHPLLNRDEIARRGQELYEGRIRREVETEENIGKIVSIDVSTGAYEVDETGIGGVERLRAVRPDAPLYGIRVGYDAVCAPGGTLTRTDDR